MTTTTSTNGAGCNNGGRPFQAAATSDRRLKALFWGDSGAGKTTLALQFPVPAVIDLEGGTEHYGGQFSFEVLKATAADDVTGAVDWLLTHDHPYRTLVIDPITLYWDALQRKWSDIFLRRNKGSKGHHLEFYDLQPRDWMAVKAELKELLRKLIQLDMNVIVTARQKAQYADAGFMRVVGETFDGEKSLPYLFDTILRLYRDDKGRFMAENVKDRTNRLPRGNFEVSYPLLERCLGKEALDRAAVPLPAASPDQTALLRQLVAASGMTPELIRTRLAAYGAESLEGLNPDAAASIIAKLQAAGVRPASTPTKETDHAES